MAGAAPRLGAGRLERPAPSTDDRRQRRVELVCREAPRRRLCLAALRLAAAAATTAAGVGAPPQGTAEQPAAAASLHTGRVDLEDPLLLAVTPRLVVTWHMRRVRHLLW